MVRCVVVVMDAARVAILWGGFTRVSTPVAEEPLTGSTSHALTLEVEEVNEMMFSLLGIVVGAVVAYFYMKSKVEAERARVDTVRVEANADLIVIRILPGFYLLDEGSQQANRDVVNAVEAGVFQHIESNAFPGS